jgi:type IV pilus biogenesis protein PilP
MQNKLMQILLFVLAVFTMPAIAETNRKADTYDPSGSMFEKITDLEQKKVLWQLEKENAQMQLEMDRMEAERARIKNEMDSMSNDENAQTQALDLERQRLEIEKQKLETQKKNMSSAQSPSKNVVAEPASKPEVSTIQEKYRLVEIIGVGHQLIATLEDNKTGQRKKVSIGKDLEGYNVDFVSLDEGVVLSKDGETQTLGVHFNE